MTVTSEKLKNLKYETVYGFLSGQGNFEILVAELCKQRVVLQHFTVA